MEKQDNNIKNPINNEKEVLGGISNCFNKDGSRKHCKQMYFSNVGVLCNDKTANYLYCHVANFNNCSFFEEQTKS